MQGDVEGDGDAGDAEDRAAAGTLGKAFSLKILT